MISMFRSSTMILSIMISPAASAQLKPVVPTGSRMAIKPTQLSDAAAAPVRYRFAQCLFRTNPKAALAMLENSDPVRVDLGRAGIKNASEALGMEDCLSDEVGASQSALGLRMPMPTIRLVIAEQAYLSKHATRPTLPSGASEKIDRPFVSKGDKLVQAQGLANFSDCVVFRDLAGADALVRTFPGTPAEAAAARALASTLGACLVEGESLALNVRSIRMFAADGLWARFARPLAS